MSEKRYAVTESYTGQVHTGFTSADMAQDFVFTSLDKLEKHEEYEFKVVEVLREWSSGDLLCGE